MECVIPAGKNFFKGGDSCSNKINLLYFNFTFVRKTSSMVWRLQSLWTVIETHEYFVACHELDSCLICYTYIMHTYTFNISVNGYQVNTFNKKIKFTPIFYIPGKGMTSIESGHLLRVFSSYNTKTFIHMSCFNNIINGGSQS